MDRIFAFIIHPMELGLIWLAVAVGSAGVGIILFTIVVRLLLAPLQIVQLRNARSMQRLQPLLNELRQKHGKDRQKMSEATMALYKEHNVNPAMGCLPTLLQFPILIGLFYALLHLGASPTGFPAHIAWVKSSCNGHQIAGWAQWFQQCYAVKGAGGTTRHVFDLFHAKFLWLHHGLGAPDSLYILPVLAGATQWIQSRMMLTRSTDPQQQMMNTMMNFMPLMIVFFATRYASGLSLYWVTSTVIGIAIQSKITGWGTLPNPRTLLGRAGGTPPRPRSGGSPPRQAARKNDVPRPASITEPVIEAPADGRNGTRGDSNGAGPPRAPRKKANRARGGRGGRRG